MSNWSKLKSLFINEYPSQRSESTIGPASSNPELFRQQPALYKSGAIDVIEPEPGLDTPLIDPVDMAVTAGSSIIGMAKDASIKKALEKQIQSLNTKKHTLDWSTRDLLEKALKVKSKEGMRDYILDMKEHFNAGYPRTSSGVWAVKNVHGQTGQGLRNYVDSDNLMDANKFFKEYAENDKLLNNQTIFRNVEGSKGQPIDDIFKEYRASGIAVPQEVVENPIWEKKNLRRLLLDKSRVDKSKSMILADDDTHPLDLQSTLFHEQSHLKEPESALKTLLEYNYVPADDKRLQLLSGSMNNSLPPDMLFTKLASDKGLDINDLARLNSSYHHNIDKVITPEYQNLLKYLTKTTRKNIDNQVNQDIFNTMLKTLPITSIDSKYTLEGYPFLKDKK